MRYICQIILDDNYNRIEEIEAPNKEICLRKILLNEAKTALLDHPYLYKMELDIRSQEELDELKNSETEKEKQQKEWQRILKNVPDDGPLFVPGYLREKN
jgi:hypothetical protein